MKKTLTTSLFVMFVTFILMLSLASCSEGSITEPAAIPPANESQSDTVYEGTPPSGADSVETNNLQLSDMVIKITSQGNTATFKLYDTAAAKELYEQLPLTLELSNFRDAQWMFYPPEKLNVTAEEAYHDGKKGELSYYASWGDVFMLYKNFYAGDEMHRLGVCLTGIDDIAGMSGSATIEIAEMEDTDMNSNNSTAEKDNRVASDGAQMQTSNPSMPTRIIETGTKINMHFGDIVIPGILNDGKTAQALIEKLPLTVRLSRYSHDFCGVIDPLLYDSDDVRYGWLNGDITYGSEANWFTVLFADEDNSEQYGDLVNIGVIDCELAKISELDGSFEVLIELAE